MVLVRAQDAQRELVAAHEALGQTHARLREKFVVVAPGAEVERLSTRVAHALSGMGELPASGDHPPIAVRASWGAAPFASGADLVDALRAADALMYEKKRAAKLARKPRSGILPAMPSGG